MSYGAENLDSKKHCFFGAEGGVSQGKYASLNMNLFSLDKRENVWRNFRIATAVLGKKVDDLFLTRQGVTANVVFADEQQLFKTYADGAVTTNPRIVLGVKTADCAPVLMADYKHGVIGVAHAGWRGAYKGVVENTVSLMLEKGAKVEDIAAAIGPCMQQKSFEVQADMRDILLAQSAENEKYFINGVDERHFNFDLSGYVEDKLKCLNINNVINSQIDTYPPENGYFSFRRNTHLGLINEPNDYPTQYSFICL